MKLFRLFHLQLFAEAGAGAGSGSGTAATTAGQAAPQQQNQSAEAPVAGATQQDAAGQGETFDQIRERYKDQFDAWANDTISKRLKGSKERTDKLSAIAETVAERYGVDPTDSDAIAKALEDDNTRYEKEALEKGLPVETVAKIHKLEAREAKRKSEAEAAQKQQAEAKRQAEIQQHFNGLQQQAEALKQMYPGFDLQTELKNPQFVKLTSPGMGIDVRTAFEVIHRDQLRGAEMQYATQRTANRISAAVQSNSRRPAENGIAGSTAVQQTSNPGRMTKEYRQQLIERARRGERITFDKI